jgi:hypothetical protein
MRTQQAIGAQRPGMGTVGGDAALSDATGPAVVSPATDATPPTADPAPDPNSAIGLIGDSGGPDNQATATPDLNVGNPNQPGPAAPDQGMDASSMTGITGIQGTPGGTSNQVLATPNLNVGRAQYQQQRYGGGPFGMDQDQRSMGRYYGSGRGGYGGGGYDGGGYGGSYGNGGGSYYQDRQGPPQGGQFGYGQQNGPGGPNQDQWSRPMPTQGGGQRYQNQGGYGGGYGNRGGYGGGYSPQRQIQSYQSRYAGGGGYGGGGYSTGQQRSQSFQG